MTNSFRDWLQSSWWNTLDGTRTHFSKRICTDHVLRRKVLVLHKDEPCVWSGQNLSLLSKLSSSFTCWLCNDVLEIVFCTHNHFMIEIWSRFQAYKLLHRLAKYSNTRRERLNNLVMFPVISMLETCGLWVWVDVFRISNSWTHGKRWHWSRLRFTYF